MAKILENEGHVKHYVKKMLTDDGWFWWSVPTGTAYGRSGISDLNAIKSGVFMAIETKFGKNKPTPQQIGYLNSVRAEDGFGFVVNEKRLDHLKAFLEAFGRATVAASTGQKVADEDGAHMLDMISEMTREL